MEEIKKMNIYEKMQAITNELGIIAKNLDVKINNTQIYKAVSEKDILENIKPLENKYRVYSYPLDRKVIDRDILEKQTEYNGKITKTNTLFMRIETIYRFVNLDNTVEFMDVKTYGDGLDPGDKAPGKAMTYADKYALMKAYKMSTGDDPDKEASPEQGYQKTEKMSMATNKQKEMIKGLYEEDKIKQELIILGKSKLSDLTVKEASDLISKKKEGK